MFPHGRHFGRKKKEKIMALNSKFDPSELQQIGEVPNIFGPPSPLYATPITPKENTLRLYEGKTPMWAPFSGGERNMFMLACDPENQARSPEGGVDGYGVEWVFVPQVGGAMVKPGNPKVLDINHWEDYVTIPDPDTWDWEGYVKNTLPNFNDTLCSMMAAPGCLFERLIACMDFDKAIVALIDDDQKEGVHRFFRAVTEVHKKTYKNVKKWFNPEIVNFNDDWGSQRAQFFSNATYREMILPYVKEIAEYVHSLGMYFDLHSCGFVEPLIPLIIEAGLDSWGGQPLNDKWKLKQQYGDKFLFTAHLTMDPNATEAEMDAAVEEFINTIGADNRCIVEIFGGPAALRNKVYVASRKNFDKLVAEGKAIL